MDGRDRKWIVPWLIALAAVAAYSGSFNGVFLLDDHKVIRNSPEIGHLWPVCYGLRFVVDFTFKLNYLVSGFDVVSYHVVNLAIHIMAGLLLYGVIRRSLLRPLFLGRYDRNALQIAAFIAAIWVAHPLQTESVTYICQRYESMMGMFLLLCLYCFIRGIDAGEMKNAWMSLSVVACALGMGSKEGMLVAPVVIFLYDYIFVTSPIRELLRTRSRYYFALLLTLLILVFLFLLDRVEGPNSGRSFAVLSNVSPATYLFTQFGVILHYLRLAAWPSSLCLDYAWPAAQGMGAILLPVLIVGILFCLALWAFLERKPSGFVGLAFFVLIAPNSSVFPIADFAFEHRMYLPLTCLVTLAVTVTHWFSEKMFSGSIISVHSRNRVYSLIGGIAVLLCVVLTAQRNKDYLSEEAMWRDIVRKRPDNLRARNDLAVALSERGRTEEALKQYGEVLSRIPADIRNRLEAGQIRVSGVFVNNSFEYNYFVAHANLGLMMFRELHDNAGAVRHYLSALAVAPSHAGVREKLKMVLRHSGIPEEKLDTELTKLLEQKTGHK